MVADEPSARVLALLVAVEHDLGESPELARTKAGAAHVALTRSYAVYLGEDPASRARLEREAALLRWAATQGIPVPAVVERTADRLVTARVAADPQAGPRFVAAAIAASDSVVAADPPPRELLRTSVSRRAPRHTIVRRFARMSASPLSVTEFRAARAAALALPHDTMTHGDFHPRNLLYDRAAGVVRLIDWATIGAAPAGTDLLSLWPQLPDPGDRAAVFAAAAEQVRDPQRLAVLHHWLAARYLADLVTGRPHRAWQWERIDPAVDRVAEARPGGHAP